MTFSSKKLLRRDHPALPPRTAFTLVELMVVIGIIAVLIAILMPALQSARRAAGAVNCASNLRQLGVGIELYANNFDGWLPFDDQSGNPASVIFWQRFATGAGIPYRPGQYHGTIWTCPMVDLDGFGPPWYFYYRWDAQYGINDNLRGLGDQPVDSYGNPAGPFVWVQLPHKLQEASANTVLLGDGTVLLGGAGYYFYPGLNNKLGNPRGTVWPAFSPWPVDPNFAKVTTFHNGYMNVSFGDGHVESLKVLTTAMLTPP